MTELSNSKEICMRNHKMLAQKKKIKCGKGKVQSSMRGKKEKEQKTEIRKISGENTTSIKSDSSTNHYSYANLFFFIFKKIIVDKIGLQITIHKTSWR